MEKKAESHPRYPCLHLVASGKSAIVRWGAHSNRAKGRVVHVSVATAWEIAIKVGQGKLPDAAGILARFEEAVDDEGFKPLHITVTHVRAAGLMKSPHRDPFDRLLAAQALTEILTLVSADAKLGALGAPVLW